MCLGEETLWHIAHGLSHLANLASTSVGVLVPNIFTSIILLHPLAYRDFGTPPASQQRAVVGKAGKLAAYWWTSFSTPSSRDSQRSLLLRSSYSRGDIGRTVLTLFVTQNGDTFFKHYIRALKNRSGSLTFSSFRVLCTLTLLDSFTPDF